MYPPSGTMCPSPIDVTSLRLRRTGREGASVMLGNAAQRFLHRCQQSRCTCNGERQTQHHDILVHVDVQFYRPVARETSQQVVHLVQLLLGWRITSLELE